MATDEDVDDVLDLVARRSDLLAMLDGQRVPKRELEAGLEYSRSTVNRAVAALADAGLVDDAPNGCRTTSLGSLLVRQYTEYVETAADVLDGRELLESLPQDVALDPSVLADADVSTPGGSSPYRPYHAFETLLGSAVGPVRVYVPSFTNPRGMELAGELARQVDLEIVFDRDLLAELRTDMPDDVAALRDVEGFTGYQTADGPAYTVAVVETESGPEGGVVVHTAAGELAGVIVTKNPDAVRWLEQQYAAVRADSERLDRDA